MREILLRIQGDASGVLSALRQFSAGLDATASKVASFLRGFGNAANPLRIFDGAKQSVQSLASIMDGAFRKVQQTTSSMTRTLVNMGRSFFFIREIRTGITGFALALGNTFAGVEKTFENFELRYTALLGSVDAARAHIIQLQELNKSTALDLPGLIELDLNLRNAGVASEKFLRIAANVGVVLGGDVNEKANQFATAIGRIAAGGEGVGIKVLTEQLRILSRNDLIREGIKFDSNNELQSTAEETLAAVMRIIETKYKDVQDMIRNSWEQIISNNKDAFQQLQRVFQQPIAEALKPIFQALPNIILNRETLASARLLGDGIVDSAKAVVNGFQIMRDAFAEAVSFVYGYIDQITGGVSSLAAAVYSALEPIGQIIRLIFSGQFEQAGQLAGAALASLASIILGRILELGSFLFSGGYNIIVSFADGIYAAAETVVMAAVTFVAELVASFLQGFSPPKEGPMSTIDTWFPRVLDAYFGSWKKADWSVLTDITDRVADYFEDLVDKGLMLANDAQRLVIGNGDGGLTKLVSDAMNEIVTTGKVSAASLIRIQNLLGDQYRDLFEQISLQLQSAALDQDLAKLQKRLRDLESSEASENLKNTLEDAKDAYNKARNSADRKAAQSQIDLVEAQQRQRDQQAALLKRQIQAIEDQRDALEDLQAGYEGVLKIMDRQAQFLENIHKEEKKRADDAVKDAERLRQAQFRYQMAISNSTQQLALLYQRLRQLNPNNPDQAQEYYDILAQIHSLEKERTEAQFEYNLSQLDSIEQLEVLRQLQQQYAEGSVEYIEIQERINGLVEDQQQLEREIAQAKLTTQEKIDQLRQEQSGLTAGSAEYLRLEKEIMALEKERANEMQRIADAKRANDMANANSEEKLAMLRERLLELDPNDPEQAQEYYDTQQQITQIEKERAEAAFQYEMALRDTQGQIDMLVEKQKGLPEGSKEWYEVGQQIIDLQDQQAREQDKFTDAQMDSELAAQDINSQIATLQEHLKTLPKHSVEYYKTLEKIHKLEKQRERLNESIARKAASAAASLEKSRLGAELAGAGSTAAELAIIDERLSKVAVGSKEYYDLLKKRHQLQKKLNKEEAAGAKAAAGYGQGIKASMNEIFKGFGDGTDVIERARQDAQEKWKTFTEGWTTWISSGEGRIAGFKNSIGTLFDAFTATPIGSFISDLFGGLAQGVLTLPATVRGVFQEFRAIVETAFTSTGGDIVETVFTTARIIFSRIVDMLEGFGLLSRQQALAVRTSFGQAVQGILDTIDQAVRAIAGFFFAVETYLNNLVPMMRRGDWSGVATAIIRSILDTWRDGGTASLFATGIVNALMNGDFGEAGRFILRSIFDTADFAEIRDIITKKIRDALTGLFFGQELKQSILGSVQQAGTGLAGDTSLRSALVTWLDTNIGTFDWQAVFGSWWIQIPAALAAGFAAISLAPYIGPIAQSAVFAFGPTGMVTKLFVGWPRYTRLVEVALARLMTSWKGVFKSLGPIAKFGLRFVDDAFKFIGNAMVTTSAAITFFYRNFLKVFTNPGPATAILKFFLSPMRLMGQAIYYLIPAFTLFMGDLGKVGAFLGSYIGPAFTKVMSPLRLFGTAFTTVFSTLSTILAPVMPLLGAFAGIAAPILLIGGALALLANNVPFVDQAIQFIIDQIPRFVDMIVGLFAVIVNYIATELPGILDKLGLWISQIGPPLLEGIIKLVAIVVQAIIDHGPAILQSLANWGLMFVTWLAGLWTTYVQPNIIPFFGYILGAIANFAGPLLEGLGEWGRQFFAWLPGATIEFLKGWPSILSTILDKIAAFAGPLLAQLGTWAVQFLSWIIPMLPDLALGLLAIMGTIIVFIVETAAVLIKKIVTEWVPALWHWVVDNDVGGKLGKALQDMGDKVMTYLGYVYDLFIEFGKNLVANIISGITGFDKAEVLAAFDSVFGFVKGIFPHSEPEETKSPFRGITSWGSEIVNTIAGGITTVEVERKFNEVASAIVDVFGKRLIPEVKEQMDSLRDNINKGNGVIKDDSETFWNDAYLGFFKNTWAVAWQSLWFATGTGLWPKFADDTKRFLDQFKLDTKQFFEISFGDEAIEKPISDSTTQVIIDLSDWRTAAKGVFDGIAQDAKTVFEAMRKQIAQVFTDIATDIVGTNGQGGLLRAIKNQIASQGMQDEFKAGGKTLGNALGDGIASGIREKIEEMARAAGEAVRRTVQAGKNEAEAASPSKLTAREIGSPISEGIAVGIINSIGKIIEAVEQAIAPVVSIGTGVVSVVRGIFENGFQFPTTQIPDAITNIGNEINEAFKEMPDNPFKFLSTSLDAVMKDATTSVNSLVAGMDRQLATSREFMTQTQFSRIGVMNSTLNGLGLLPPSVTIENINVDGVNRAEATQIVREGIYEAFEELYGQFRG